MFYLMRHHFGYIFGDSGETTPGHGASGAVPALGLAADTRAALPPLPRSFLAAPPASFLAVRRLLRCQLRHPLLRLTRRILSYDLIGA